MAPPVPARSTSINESSTNLLHRENGDIRRRADRGDAGATAAPAGRRRGGP